MLRSDEIPPSLENKDPALVRVLLQNYGASGELSEEDQEWLSQKGYRARLLKVSAVDDGDGEYVASEDHDPNPWGYSGGTHGDLLRK